MSQQQLWYSLNTMTALAAISNVNKTSISRPRLIFSQDAPRPTKTLISHEDYSITGSNEDYVL